MGNSFGLNPDQIMIKNSVRSFIQMFNYLMDSFRYCDTKTKYGLFKTFVCLCIYALCGVCQINVLADSWDLEKMLTEITHCTSDECRTKRNQTKRNWTERNQIKRNRTKSFTTRAKSFTIKLTLNFN